MKTRLLRETDPDRFKFLLKLPMAAYAKKSQDREAIAISHFLRLGDSLSSHGFAGIYHEDFTFPELAQLCEFIHQIGSSELAAAIARGRDTYYRGRKDVLTFEDCDAAGLDGNHLTDEEWLILNQLEDRVSGPHGLMTKADEAFLCYLKAHPAILDELEITKQKVLKNDVPAIFWSDLEKLHYEALQSGKITHDHVIFAFLGVGGHVAANGFHSIYYQAYDFEQIGRICDFARVSGCEELARILERGRDLYYRGRKDLLTFDARDAAGFDGNHLTDEEYQKLSSMEDAIIGPESLLARAEEPFMRYIKSHPELLDALD